MEHMRMDPKHQFAAQYVLSRAAAERRERELLAGSSLGESLCLLSFPFPDLSFLVDNALGDSHNLPLVV